MDGHSFARCETQATAESPASSGVTLTEQIEGEVEFIEYFAGDKGMIVQKRVVGGKEYYSRMTKNRFMRSLESGLALLRKMDE
jgi:hypothetical protein